MEREEEKEEKEEESISLPLGRPSRKRVAIRLRRRFSVLDGE